jgi:hypothetical protein
MPPKASARTLVPDFGEATFNDSLTINNRYFPLVPETTFTYVAQADDQVETNVVFVTDDAVEILGIQCRVVEDRVWVNGLLTEETFDWYAQDDEGNVWYMGEYTTEYEYPPGGGPPIETHDGSWNPNIDDAEPGFIMLAHPQPGDSYRQEYFEGQAEDMGKVLRLNASVSVPWGDYTDCLVTKEWTPLDPGVVEQKYYAPGVGLVLVEELKGKTVEVELIDIH